MFDWIKKHKILVLIIAIVIVFGVPLLIHVMYKIEAPIPFLAAEWTAGELLSYYGSILAFLGTVILGVLALYQNHIIKTESDRRTDLLEQREHESNMPKFLVSTKRSNGGHANLVIGIRNVSENPAREAVLSNMRVENEDGEIVWKSTKTKKTFQLISAAGEIEIDLKNQVLQIGNIVLIEMRCVDKYDEPHQYIIRGENNDVKTFPKFRITELQ